MKRNVVQEWTEEMALACITVGRPLPEECREYILSKQLIRSGISPGAMVVNRGTRPVRVIRCTNCGLKTRAGRKSLLAALDP